MDFSVTQEVLRAYGDMVKETMKQVLWAIAAARQDGISIEVSGLDEFDIRTSAPNWTTRRSCSIWESGRRP